MNKVRWVLLAVCVTAVCGAVSVLAEEGAGRKRAGEGRGQGPGHFQACDADGNGALSLDEFKAMRAKRDEMMKERLGDKYDAAWAAKRPAAEDVFARLDADKDGSLTKEEMAAGRQRRARGEGQGKRERKGKAEAEGCCPATAPAAPVAPVAPVAPAPAAE